MQLVLKGKNFVISDRVRDYVERKVGKLDRYLPDISEARVEITQEKTKSAKDRNVVQLTLRTNGTILRAEDRSEAIYASIDAVVDKIHRQIVRYKGKRQDRWQANAEGRAEELPIEEPVEESRGEIVRVKRFEVRPMTAEEAIEQMELLGHHFYVFLNADENAINVVYQRDDGNYGLLQPEYA